MDNPRTSTSFEDFNFDVFQSSKEEVEEPTEIPQNDSIHDGRNDLNDEEPLRYRSI